MNTEWKFPWKQPTEVSDLRRFNQAKEHVKTRIDARYLSKPEDSYRKKLSQLLALMLTNNNFLIVGSRYKAVRNLAMRTAAIWTFTYGRSLSVLDGEDFLTLYSGETDKFNEVYYDDVLHSGVLVWERIQLCDNYRFKQMSSFLGSFFEKRSKMGKRGSAANKTKNLLLLEVESVELEKDRINSILQVQFGRFHRYIDECFFYIYVQDDSEPSSQEVMI